MHEVLDPSLLSLFLLLNGVVFGQLLELVSIRLLLGKELLFQEIFLGNLFIKEKFGLHFFLLSFYESLFLDLIGFAVVLGFVSKDGSLLFF